MKLRILSSVRIRAVNIRKLTEVNKLIEALSVELWKTNKFYSSTPPVEANDHYTLKDVPRTTVVILVGLEKEHL